MSDVDDIDFEEIIDEGDGETDKYQGYDNFGQYWNIKQNKLRAQFAPKQLKSDIFKGVCIFVNGRTDPSQNQLRDLICEHGGLHEYVLNRSTVTHIVASVLPTGKIMQLGEKDVIVRPEWITESITAGKRLDIYPYRLYNQLDPRQSTIDFGKTTAALPEPSSSKTAADPNFLQTYYQSSRLHHLSVWREELKRFACELMRQKSASSIEKNYRGRDFILHVDMDCFFASVSLIDRPELRDQPVVIAHGANGNENNTTSRSDVSSCNYPARLFGIHNGMPLGRARQLCPQLTVLPYDFDRYNQVARKLYQVLASYADILMAVSCDEAYLQVNVEPDMLIPLISELRSKVQEECNGCTASVGVSSTALLARLATKRAKPNGQFYIDPSDCIEHIKEMSIDDIPGVGWSISERIATKFKAETCGQLQLVPLSDLQNEFGPSIGKMLWERCRGIDSRAFTEMAAEKPRKSVGTEVSWGVRLHSEEETKRFVNGLCDQVSQRLQEVQGAPHRITIKVMIAQSGAGEPRKHLGHGICDSFSKSQSWSDDLCASADDIFAKAWPLLLSLISPQWQQVRGIGIFVSDLRMPKNEETKKPSITDYFAPKSAKQNSLEQQLERHGISIDVFRELPESIQQDIIHEINNPVVSAPKTPPKPTHPTTPPPKMQSKRHKRPSPSSQLTLTQLWQQKTRQDDLQEEDLPEGVDRDFLMALPSSIRQELINEAKEAPPSSPTKRRLITADYNIGDLRAVNVPIDLVSVLPISFEGYNVVSDIINVIEKGEYNVLELEAFLNGLVDYNILEPLASILGCLCKKNDRLVERIVKEFSRRNEGKRLLF